MSKIKDIYLVAKYVTKPKDHVNTSRKGWMDDPNNIRYDESMEIVRGLRNRDVDAQVVLNLSRKIVERNRFKTDKDFDEIFMYYFTNYNKYLLPVMAELDPDYLNQLAEQIRQGLEEATQSETTQPNTVDAQYEEVASK